MDTLDTLRTRKKAATRQSLHEAALRLAMERGLDGVTVEDIAGEVGVSRRTFSNYFANKEDAILHADRERTRELMSLVAGRPEAEGPWQALRAASGELYRAQAVPDRSWVAQLRLLRRHPSLLARQAGDQIALERDLAAVLLARGHGLDEELARLMTATFLAAVRTASVRWLEGAGEQPLPELVDRLLGRVSFE
ncbi:TetR/AcrR family transcriptional regulator [Amycolatopsis australiensis]|uniref:DNA-binding transcriptional regulator, AcrR family n=1 Tax=Amycolatopsis australiensis TaxID=546364 RepID=A0A1K1SMK7_9PSEU|nr:TetR/AcrR family transcriptional regulator [Amycolatopsis australiensis]SFW85530.1 DNA-binding transcriptional regulator, AcrR family [Amycolatopsis australiensis]